MASKIYSVSGMSCVGLLSDELLLNASLFT